jgi:hypothetical protein
LHCDLAINKNYIESSCGLTNGVRFEQLQVDSFYEDKTPKIFRVVIAFEGHLKDSIYTNQVDRIYFNRPTGMYVWSIDTNSNGVYRKWGMHKERIDRPEKEISSKTAEIIVISDHDSIQQLANETKLKISEYQAGLHKTCPISFTPDTWYFINFFDQRYEAYLYIDKTMNFNLEKIRK